MSSPISPQTIAFRPRLYSPSSTYSSSSSGSSSCTPEPELDTATSYTQQQRLREWIQLFLPEHRSKRLLPSLHREALITGLIFLRNRIDEMIPHDRELFLEFCMLLSDIEENRMARAYSYTGWYFHPPPAERLDVLHRSELQELIHADLVIYDDLVRSKKKWVREIEKLEERKRERWHEERRRRRRVVVREREFEEEDGEGSGGPVQEVWEAPRLRRDERELRVRFDEDEEIPDYRALMEQIRLHGEADEEAEYYA